ncbi:MAG: hypothetical protein ABI670_17760 [Chloroflexota bacterium]
MFTSSLGVQEPEPANTQYLSRTRVGNLALTAILLGIIWGVVEQAMRDHRLLSDWLLMLLSLLLLLALLLVASRKLRFSLVGMPVRAGAVAALFLLSAVITHYAYYIGTLALGLGNQGASLDLSQPGTYTVLWQLIKSSIAQWLFLALIGGMCLGALISWLLPVVGRARIAGRALDGRR